MFFNTKIWDDFEKEVEKWEKEDYTQPTSSENQELNYKLYELVDKVQNSLINTFGYLPDAKDIDIRSVTKDDNTYLVIELTEEFKNI